MTVGGSHSTSSTMTSFFIQEWYPIWSSTPHLTKMVLNPSTGNRFAQSSQSTKVEGSNPGPGLPVYILCVLSEYSWSLLHSKDMHKHRFNGDEIFLKCQRERKFFFSKTYIKNRMHWFSNAFQPIFNLAFMWQNGIQCISTLYCPKLDMCNQTFTLTNLKYANQF